MKEGWELFRSGSRIKGAGQTLAAAWDISLIDLRLRSSNAILMGRLNRVASIVPLAYALAASANGAPWGLRGSAAFDIGLSLVVWAFMELVMVAPEERTTSEAIPATYTNGASASKQSVYSVRPVELGDLDRLEELELRNWKEQAATREVIVGRINTYPEGQLAAVHTTVVGGAPVKSKLAAWCSVMPANEQHLKSFATWDDLTSDGTISATDRDGDVIIGVNLTSVTEGGTYILLAEILASVVEGGKAKLIGGSRLTGFMSFSERRVAEGKRPLSADAYARLREIRGFRINEQRHDAGEQALSDDEYCELATNMRDDQGLAPLADDDVPDYVCSNVRGYMSIPGAKLVRVVADYFRDPASADYGVIIEWPNPIPRPLRGIAPIKTFVVKQIRSGIADEWEQRKQHLRDLAAKRARERVPGYLQRTDKEAATPQPAGVSHPAISAKAVKRP
jgi:hypothetical protein